MKLLVIGSGGREHALAWRLSQSRRVTQVFVAPGNGGTHHSGKLENVALHSSEELVAFAQNQAIAFTVVGPEAPLAAGIVDTFRAQGLTIFGPTQAATQLESSKDFAKAFMTRYGIPTARYQTFSDAAAAHDYVAQQGAPLVIKADGLAAGKGVIVATTLSEAHAAVNTMLGNTSPNNAAQRVIIEEYLDGEEVSFIVMVDGHNILPLATSQDHKRLYDGDQGPNTGGMGAYSPAPLVSPVLDHRIMTEIIQPTVQGMARDGIPYTGFLYAGLMIAPGIDSHRAIKVLEFNCRLGDPETQPLMMRIKSDLLDVLEHAQAGTLDQAHIVWDPRPALGVVLAAQDYPDTPRLGDLITGLPSQTSDCMVFHAATQQERAQLKTKGGRVLCVTALGDSLALARQRVYETIPQIHFEGCHYRTDIGWRALMNKR